MNFRIFLVRTAKLLFLCRRRQLIPRTGRPVRGMSCPHRGPVTSLLAADGQISSASRLPRTGRGFTVTLSACKSSIHSCILGYSSAQHSPDFSIRTEMEAPPVSVMPVTGGTINMMEYLLQGSVLDQALESLLHRLRGLCDNMEPETFMDHELVYLLKGQQGNPFILRARHSLSHPTVPWHLRYLGQPEVGDKSRHALVRNCLDVAASHSLPDFLNEMGFRMDHEFVANGHIFRRGALKVVVSKLSRVLVPGNTENTERLSLSYLVELSVLAPAGQDTVSEDMRSFAEQLKPLVHLEKIDPSKQRH